MSELEPSGKLPTGPRLDEMMRELQEANIDFPEFPRTKLEDMASQDELTPLERCQRAFFALDQAEIVKFIFWMVNLRAASQTPAKKKRRGKK